MVRRWHCIHDELKAVVVTCIRSSQLKFQQDEGLVRPHPKLRNYRRLVGAGGGELVFFRGTVATGRLPVLWWVIPHPYTYGKH